MARSELPGVEERLAGQDPVQLLDARVEAARVDLDRHARLLLAGIQGRAAVANAEPAAHRRHAGVHDGEVYERVVRVDAELLGSDGVAELAAARHRQRRGERSTQRPGVMLRCDRFAGIAPPELRGGPEGMQAMLSQRYHGQRRCSMAAGPPHLIPATNPREARVTQLPCKFCSVGCLELVVPQEPSLNASDEELMRRMHRDLIDSYDEELELELEDRSRTDSPDAGAAARTEEQKAGRRQYFRELFRLQAELVKLQDWVASTGHKVVILFEGRDAAGKGGVIKRITQRLNPRVVPRGRAAGAQRPRAHAVVLPALRVAPAGGRRDRAVRPQLVQPRRRRARDGLLHRRPVRGVLPHRCPSSRRCWCAPASS